VCTYSLSSVSGENICGSLGIVEADFLYAPIGRTVIFIEGTYKSGVLKPAISLLGSKMVQVKLDVINPVVYGTSYQPILASINTATSKASPDYLGDEPYIVYNSNGANNSFHDLTETRLRKVQLTFTDELDSIITFVPRLRDELLFQCSFEFRKMYWHM